MFSPQNSYTKDDLVACSNGELFTKDGDGRLRQDGEGPSASRFCR